MRPGRRFVLGSMLAAGIALVPPVLADGRWLAAWRETTPMTTPRAGAAAVVVDGVVYVIGGVDGRDFLDTVEYSRLRPDGGLGPWRAGPRLDEARGFFSAVAADGWIYVIGGGNGPHGHRLLASVERARVLDGGGLGPWQRMESTLTRPRRCVKVVRIDRRLYALGGFNGRLLDSLEEARLLDDGGLSDWRPVTERLTIPRYINAAKAVGRRIYVVGGHDAREGTGLRAVETAEVVDGRLRSWRSLPSLRRARYALAAAVGKGRLYALGGLDGAIYSDTVEVVELGREGFAGDWRLTTSLSSPRANLVAFVADGRLYVAGGTNRDGYFRSVEYAEIGADGRLGIVADVVERRRIAERQAARDASAAARARLPNAGRVLEVVQTAAYSYIAVERSDGTRIWLAAPRMTVEAGDRLRFSRGLEMTRFHSRALDRDFDAILFVERAERSAPSGLRSNEENP